MSAATDVWIDVHSEAFGVSGVVRAGVSHRPRYWATLRTRSERDPPSCVTPHQFPCTDSERNSGVGTQDRQSDPRIEGRGRALRKCVLTTVMALPMVVGSNLEMAFWRSWERQG